MGDLFGALIEVGGMDGVSDNQDRALVQGDEQFVGDFVNLGGIGGFGDADEGVFKGHDMVFVAPDAPSLIHREAIDEEFIQYYRDCHKIYVEGNKVIYR